MYSNTATLSKRPSSKLPVASVSQRVETGGPIQLAGRRPTTLRRGVEVVP